MRSLQIGRLPGARCGGCCFSSREWYRPWPRRPQHVWYSISFIPHHPVFWYLTLIPLRQFVFILCLLSHPPSALYFSLPPPRHTHTLLAKTDDSVDKERSDTKKAEEPICLKNVAADKQSEARKILEDWHIYQINLCKICRTYGRFT